MTWFTPMIALVAAVAFAAADTVPSPSGKLSAWIDCTEEPGNPGCRVVICDRDGRELQRFHPKTVNASGEVLDCGAVMRVMWVGEDRIGADCHLNPSLGAYVETSLADGRVTRRLRGLWFEVSPDFAHIAHLGPVVHFAPPFIQTHQLHIDGKTIYPPGPREIKPQGLRYSGIHEFQPPLDWSADGRQVSFIDCTYDWTADVFGALSAAYGTKSHRVCSRVSVALDGQFTRKTLSPPGLLK